MKQTDCRCNAAVSWLASPSHPYEDSSSILSRELPLVRSAKKGELFAVFDGIGSAPEGGRSARTMTASLPRFFKESADATSDEDLLIKILQATNLEINSWGMIKGTAQPLGGCVGTVAWCEADQLTIFHVGDTVGMVLRYGEKPQLFTELHETHGRINRYFGMGESLSIDVVKTTLDDGDLILLMSDGVTKAFSPMEAAALVLDIDDIGIAAGELTTQSRARGSVDDITVVLVEVELE